MNTAFKNLNIKVLMYQRIKDKPAGKISNWQTVKEERFRQHLKLIDSLNFTPITFMDYQLYLEGQLALPKKPIILTFEDGHLDTYKVALPILREFGMKAVIYVIGNRSPRYAWWSQNHENDESPLMTNEQILQAREDGFEIGAHSMTHTKFTHLCKAELREEIVGSKKSLEALLDETILSFSYPYGLYDQRAYAIVRNSGFKFACGVHTGPPRFGDDIFDIRRQVIGNVGVTQFLLRLLTPFEYMEWMYHKLWNKPREKSISIKDLEIPNVDYEKTFKNTANPINK